MPRAKLYVSWEAYDWAPVFLKYSHMGLLISSEEQQGIFSPFSFAVSSFKIYTHARTYKVSSKPKAITDEGILLLFFQKCMFVFKEYVRFEDYDTQHQFPIFTKNKVKRWIYSMQILTLNSQVPFTVYFHYECLKTEVANIFSKDATSLVYNIRQWHTDAHNIIHGTILLSYTAYNTYQ